jgi:hypothetical protein
MLSTEGGEALNRATNDVEGPSVPSQVRQGRQHNGYIGVSMGHSVYTGADRSASGAHA